MNVWHLSDPPSFSLPTTFKKANFSRVPAHDLSSVTCYHVRYPVVYINHAACLLAVFGRMALQFGAGINLSTRICLLNVVSLNHG